MRIYLAARFARQEELRGHKAMLEARGHKIVSRWITEHVLVPDATDHQPEAERVAREDSLDLYQAECLVLFTDGQPSRGGGRHVEFGYALARRMKLVVIGPRENAFHHLEEVMVFPTLEDALGVFTPEPLRVGRGIDWEVPR